MSYEKSEESLKHNVLPEGHQIPHELPVESKAQTSLAAWDQRQGSRSVSDQQADRQRMRAVSPISKEQTGSAAGERRHDLAKRKPAIVLPDKASADDRIRNGAHEGDEAD